MKKLNECTVDRRVALKDRREDDRRQINNPTQEPNLRRRVLISSGIVEIDRRMRTRRKEDRTHTTSSW